MAAVGANTPIIGLLLNSFIGISLGSNVVVANAVGKKDLDGVSKTVHTSILLALAGGVLMVGICGVRITWIYAVFPNYGTYQNLMIVYPISLCTAAVLILIALLILKPSARALSETKKMLPERCRGLIVSYQDSYGNR